MNNIWENKKQSNNIISNTQQSLLDMEKSRNLWPIIRITMSQRKQVKKSQRLYDQYKRTLKLLLLIGLRIERKSKREKIKTIKEESSIKRINKNLTINEKQIELLKIKI